MSKPTEGKSAFPSPPVGTGDPRDGVTTGCPGMSLRQYYIGKALQGFCANQDLNHFVPEGVARLAIEHADAVMSILYPQPNEEPNQ